MMKREEIAAICKMCKKRSFDPELGVTCSLTNKRGEFEGECKDFEADGKVVMQNNEKEEEKRLAEYGKRKTLIVFAIFIGLSLLTFVFSFIAFKALDATYILDVIIRILLFVGILMAIYYGKSWAKNVMTFLLIIGIVLSIFTTIYLIFRSPFFSLIMMPLIAFYGYAIYFFNADKDFLNFFRYQIKNA